jgi:glycosyltransferase involved in cell wall biosynthesis
MRCALGDEPTALERVTVIVPARDEEAAIADVVAELIDAGARRIIVVDNASRDATATRARAAGAVVIDSRRRGYGWACLAGTEAARGDELIGFMDGDGSFRARDLARLASIALDGSADLVLGVRSGTRAAPRHQRIGNALVLALFRILYGRSLPDTAPLRVIRGDLLRRLEMRGSRYAWLTEMLAKAARLQARIAIVPVAYGPRHGGKSKVSGSLRGSVLAGIDLTHVLIELRRW